jgi:hypothetical protein
MAKVGGRSGERLADIGQSRPPVYPRLLGRVCLIFPGFSGLCGGRAPGSPA